MAVVAIDPAQLRAAWSDPQFTVAELAARFGCSPGTVKRHAERLELPARKRGPRSGSALTGGRWAPNRRGVLEWVRDGG